MLEQGFSVAEVATRLNLNQGTQVYGMTQASKSGKNTAAMAGAQKPVKLAEGNKPLCKEQAVAGMECDTLIKR